LILEALELRLLPTRATRAESLILSAILLALEPDSDPEAWAAKYVETGATADDFAPQPAPPITTNEDVKITPKKELESIDFFIKRHSLSKR
jgi:hypothetical protein